MTSKETSIKTASLTLPQTEQKNPAKTRSVKYSQEFFEQRQTRVKRSASALVPIVVELIKPTSVIDIGCGTGEFLAAFKERGVEEISGIDGDYVDRNLLAIPVENFKGQDLSRPFTVNKRYDLAVCLEVAEHIEPERADSFIHSLTQTAPVILFSAAIPFQGGDHHVNEQWPEYWAQLFKTRGYIPVDALRKRIWNNQQIEFWYRQNVLLFCTQEALTQHHVLLQEAEETNSEMLSLVHPEFYMECNTKYLRALRKALQQLEGVRQMKNSVRQLIRKR